MSPEEKAYSQTGSVFIHKDFFTDEEQSFTVTFNSTRGNYFIKVDDCLVEKIIK